jgi:hypothetical protein
MLSASWGTGCLHRYGSDNDGWYAPTVLHRAWPEDLGDGNSFLIVYHVWQSTVQIVACPARQKRSTIRNLVGRMINAKVILFLTWMDFSRRQKKEPLTTPVFNSWR